MLKCDVQQYIDALKKEAILSKQFMQLGFMNIDSFLFQDCQK